MASTIQIKRGTGSAVPSGLADGELAINLDNGKLYLGKLQNIGTKEQQLSLEAQDLVILKAKYTELLKDELPKDEEAKEDKAEVKKV